jgi:tetratricopeptide (TPR) repeat protein
MDAYLRKAKSLLDLRYTDHGRYERAVTMEEQAQRLNPMDGAATHALLIVSLREVVQAEATEEQAEIGQVWQRVIRNTALLLHNETFWEEWRTRCEKRYEMLIDQHAIAEVRHRLEQSLLDCLPLPSTLGVALRREFTAAQVLAQAGGFPCSGMDGHRLVCGPQMLRHLGFERQFGRFARAVADQQTQQTPGMQHFKRLFSRLGEAQVLLEHGFPQEALGALQRACCKTCASDSHQCNLEAKWLPHVCQAHCSDFALGNPAYAAWEDRRDRLWQDAVALASEACVALANAQMTVTPMQFESIVMHWQDALRFARTAGTVETTQEKLVDGILGRAANLTEHEQLDDAIALLDQAHSLFQEPFRGQLQGRLAALLSERGVAAASRPNPDWDASFRDIRRSIEINPHVPRRVSRFARALRRRAVEVYEEDRHTAARLLLEALRVLGTGLERFPQEEENLEAQVIKLEGDMEALGFLLYEDGVTQAGSGEYEGGLEDLWLAYELAPHVPQIQQNICRVSEEYVHEARQRGHAIEAAEVLDRALYHFPYDQRLRALRSQVL